VNDPRPGRGGGSAEPENAPPEYNVYRSRRRPLGGAGDLDSLRRRLSRRSEGSPRGPREPGRITPGRVIKWIALALAGWLALSLVLFLVSAQTREGIPDDAQQALASGGSLLGGSTILVLGSDARGGDSIDESQAGPARADSIMLVRAAFGSVRKLSIPRDSLAQIPGHDPQKINAAYAFGGPALMIETVEDFMGNGVQINHLIEVDFEHFPELIDALGGIDVTVEHRICSPPFDNFWKGLDFRAGEQHLDGAKALGFSRIRKNPCQPNETDIERAARQQQVLNGIKDQVTSLSTFVRLPWVSWKAPQALRTDLKGPGLLALFTDLATSGTEDTQVLEPSCLGCGPGGSLVVSDGAKADAARTLLEGS
jgi:LCP family protein required for cell wall assembly